MGKRKRKRGDAVTSNWVEQVKAAPHRAAGRGCDGRSHPIRGIILVEMFRDFVSVENSNESGLCGTLV